MHTTPKKIWITRAEPGASATAKRVVALGHAPFVAPLRQVQVLEDVSIDLHGVAALAFTSANGVRAFAASTADRGLRVFAVGPATARAARAAGFRHVLSSDDDVAALADGIAARRRDLNGLVLHAGAAEPAGDLMGALAAHGIAARGLSLYDTLPAALSSTETAELASIHLVLLHSPKAARALGGLLRKTPLPNLRALGLSKSVMRPLSRAKLAGKAFAPFPLEAAMLNLIDRTL